MSPLHPASVLKQILGNTLCTFWPLTDASVFNVSRGFFNNNPNCTAVQERLCLMFTRTLIPLGVARR